MATPVAERDVPAEIAPAALAFGLLDQPLLRVRKVREEQREASEHRPRLEVQVLNGSLLVGIESLQAS